MQQRRNSRTSREAASSKTAKGRQPRPSDAKAEPPAIALADAAWREIEGSVGLNEPSLRFRRRVAKCAWFYLRPRYGDLLNPPLDVRSKHWRAALVDLKKKATALLACLDLQHPSQASKSMEDPYVRAHAWVALNLLPHEAAERLMQTLGDIIRKTEEIVVDLPKDSGGRLDDVRQHQLIRCLADVYSDFTRGRAGVSFPSSGKGSYGGPFVRFVEIVSKHLLPTERRKGANALGKIIQRALSGSGRAHGLPTPRDGS